VRSAVRSAELVVDGAELDVIGTSRTVGGWEDRR
jgi:hypothetical protein